MLSGYTKRDLTKFQNTLAKIITSGVLNEKQTKVLEQITDFLDMLLMEGRI